VTGDRRNNYWIRTGSQPYSRRGVLKGIGVAGAGAATLGLVGCGDDDGGSTGDSGPTTSPDAASTPKAPTPGGKFRMATRTFEVSLDPHYTNRPELIYVWQAISHPLVELDEKNEVVPGGVAEKWEVLDPQTITFTLWPGIKFHDKPPASGRPFTSADVKYSIERMKTKGATRASLFAQIASIETPDDATVTLKLLQPSVPLLYFLGSTYNVMVNREAVEKYGDLKTQDGAIGVGPFVVQSLSIENGASLTRNPEYFRPGLPYLESVDFVPLKDPDIALPNAFRAGESELVALSSTDLKQIRSQSKDVVTSRVGSGGVLYGFLMNHAVAPWKDLRVRKAIHLAINRQAIGETIAGEDAYLLAPIPLPLGSYAIPEKELLELPGYRPSKDADIAEAKKLLIAAGFANDFKDLQIDMQSSAQYNYSEQWELLVPQFQQLGIKVNMKSMEHAAFKAAEAKKDFAASFSAFLVDSEPDSLLSILHHTKGSRNYVNYSNSEIDAIIDKQRGEFDRDARVKLCQEASRKLIDDVAYAWTTTAWSNMTHHDYLKGYKANPSSVYESGFAEVWFDKA